MKNFLKSMAPVLLVVALTARADNQTATLSPVLPQTSLPFSIVIEQENFQLPVGLHSGIVGEYQGKLAFVAGRINGLHGFGLNPFPVDMQNTSIYVLDLQTGAVTSRSLSDPSSGLTQQQIDSLSVTSPQWFQEGNTLYMTGGYGIDTASSTFSTKPFLTALYIPGIIKWVTEPWDNNNSVIKNMSQLFNIEFQVTGGEMFKVGDTVLLVFGQNFTGVYTPGGNGDYTRQVKRFKITSNGGQVSAIYLGPKPEMPDPSYRRRDYNLMPALFERNNLLEYGLVAYAGVFTLTTGVWTVPVTIDKTGTPSMADPAAPATFKQAMNQYVTAAAGLYSRRERSMYHLFFGGISFGFFSGGVFQTDSEIPFINQATTIKMDAAGNFTQYLMDNEYPVILSTGSNPGNPLLFGAGAYFVPARVKQYTNHIISLDSIRQPTVIGYIIGGIMSTLPNTNTDSDSSGSPYIFKVTLIPRT